MNRMADQELLLAADWLNDIEGLRIATENRLRALEHGKDHATPAPPIMDGPVYRVQQANLAVLQELERKATNELKRAVRRHPLGPWVERTVGVGEKQGARLLAAIGDPLRYETVDPETGEVVEHERTVSKLWAYCGLHTVPAERDAKASGDGAYSAVDRDRVQGENVAARRKKGVRANWNATAKMRAYLVAESCMKQRTSPYRAVYDREREKWATRETSDAHKHAHALRIVAKTVLRDIYREALRIESGSREREAVAA